MISPSPKVLLLRSLQVEQGRDWHKLAVIRPCRRIALML